eukprot:GHVP01019835.1.p1 GENE.GHVP01019835.1~~GHVP01019835.1.p1  ORF type:complete len:506 (-),score=82.60 GHVP01019835.1:759-2276(-)
MNEDTPVMSDLVEAVHCFQNISKAKGSKGRVKGESFSAGYDNVKSTGSHEEPQKTQTRKSVRPNNYSGGVEASGNSGNFYRGCERNTNPGKNYKREKICERVVCLEPPEVKLKSRGTSAFHKNNICYVVVTYDTIAARLYAVENSQYQKLGKDTTNFFSFPRFSSLSAGPNDKKSTVTAWQNGAVERPLLAVGSQEGPVNIWDVNGRLQETIVPSEEGNGVSVSIAFSPDNLYLAVGNRRVMSDERTSYVDIWDCTSSPSKLLQSFSCDSSCMDLEWSPSSLVLSCVAGTEITVCWMHNSEVQKINSQYFVNWMAWQEDSRLMCLSMDQEDNNSMSPTDHHDTHESSCYLWEVTNQERQECQLLDVSEPSRVMFLPGHLSKFLFVAERSGRISITAVPKSPEFKQSLKAKVACLLKSMSVSAVAVSAYVEENQNYVDVYVGSAEGILSRVRVTSEVVEEIDNVFLSFPLTRLSLSSDESHLSVCRQGAGTLVFSVNEHFDLNRPK